MQINLGMDICQIEPQDTEGHVGGGGIRGSQIKKSGEAVKRLDRLAPNLVHRCIFTWEWIYAKQIAPRDTRGHFGGQTFKSQGKLSNGWTEWHQLWFTSADSSGKGHRLNTRGPSIPQGHVGWVGGWIRGHTFKSLGRLS